MLTTALRAYGVADLAEVRQMSGRELLQAILDGRLPAPPIAGTLSFWLAEIGDGVAMFEGDAGPHLLNPLGFVHGGWALALIDSAAGCAAHTLLPAGVSYTTIETKANFSRPITQNMGTVRAKDAWSAAGGVSCPARRGSSMRRAACWRRHLDADGPHRQGGRQALERGVGLSLPSPGRSTRREAARPERGASLNGAATRALQTGGHAR